MTSRWASSTGIQRASSCSWESRLGVGSKPDGEDGRGDDPVHRRLVELVHEVEVVERLDVGGAEPGLLRELAERARRRRARRARASPTRIATGRAGSARATGAAAGSRDARRRAPSGRPGTSSSRRGPGGRGSRAMIACSCSRCIRSWTPAKTSHSPQRSWPTSGWSSGHGSVSCPATVRADRSTIRWLWAILRRSVARSASAGPGTPRHHAGRRRPATRPAAAFAGGERTGRRGRRSRARSPGRRSSPPRRPSRRRSSSDRPLDDGGQRLRQAMRAAGRSARRSPSPAVRLDLPADLDDADPSRCRATPRRCPAPRSSSASTQVGHRWPLAIFVGVGSTAQPHIATIPTTGPEREDDPNARRQPSASRRVEQSDAEDRDARQT